MNTVGLRQMLEAENVDPRAYSLEGGAPIEAYVLEGSSGPRWAVFYSERGLRSGETWFETEDEACVYMLEHLLRDPTTRRL